MSNRWQYKVVEVKAKLFGGGDTANLQKELDSLGQMGWELLHVQQTVSLDVYRLFLKRPA